MKAMLWDLDDTLLNTLAVRMRALAHAYEVNLGCKTDPEALWRSHRGGTLEDLGRRLVGDRFQVFADTYRDYYYTHEHNVRPFEGISLVLETVREARIPMAVVTSKIAWGATDELAKAGILQHFQAVVGYDDTELHKPDPEPVFEALDRLCLASEQDVLFVGDSPADIWAARNAGIKSVAALWGTIDAELLLDSMPDYRAERPLGVLDVLREVLLR